MAKRTLWCFARRTPEGWWAICTSLDIAVEGATLDEVRARMDSAIVEYLCHVATLPEAERARLLDRPAPIRLRVGLWGLFILGRILGTVFNHRGGGPKGLSAIRFRECPAVA